MQYNKRYNPASMRLSAAAISNLSNSDSLTDMPAVQIGTEELSGERRRRLFNDSDSI